MRKFRKLVAIEPVNLIPSAKEQLMKFADEVIMFDNVPSDDDEIARRVGDADAVLLSFTSRLEKSVMEKCANIKYIGMCCSLYSPESANVDIRFADTKGITVTGIRDYGDEGVIEYVVRELASCLHGFGMEPWEGMPREITGLKVGVVGLGKSGGMIADAMKFFGAEVSYFARSEKEHAKAKGYKFLPLNDLLEQSDVVFCCLNKNTVLLHHEQFQHLGDGKLLFNTGLSPAWDEEPFLDWVGRHVDGKRKNHCFCDTMGALGGPHLFELDGVHCMNVSTGCTKQAFDRLTQKVLTNIENFLK